MLKSSYQKAGFVHGMPCAFETCFQFHGKPCTVPFHGKPCVNFGSKEHKRHIELMAGNFPFSACSAVHVLHVNLFVLVFALSTSRDVECR